VSKPIGAIFDGSEITYFSVPHALIGDNANPRRIRKLSVPALRLYLYILATAGRRHRPIVSLSNDDVAQSAGVGKNRIVKTRLELQDCGLIAFREAEHSFHYEVLDPITRKRLPSALRRPDLNFNQKVHIFEHYLGKSRGGEGYMFDCPFHDFGETDWDDGKKIKGSQRHLSVKATKKTNGLWWHCFFPPCKHHGKTKVQPIAAPTWTNEVSDRVLIGGGGDVMEFVAAMSWLQTGTPTTREAAIQELEELIDTLFDDAGEPLNLGANSSAIRLKPKLPKTVVQ